MSESKQISIHVLFFGAARDEAGSREINLSIETPATVASASALLGKKFPGLQRFGRSLLFAINQEYASLDEYLHDKDELAIFPPVSGGSQPMTTDSSKDFFELTHEPIDVGAVTRRVVLPECGATVSLDGYAREWTAGRRTLYLVYEGYESMAIKELERLGAQAHQQFAIAHIGIVHRLGKLEIGESSVVVSVSAPHRGAAFAACEWAIKELKRTVPIWKKEVFEDGEVWVEGEGNSV